MEEEKFWSESKKNSKYRKYSRLINSSLYIYVQHRMNILREFFELLKRIDPDGNLKKEPESKIHDLLFPQGQYIDNGKVSNEDYLRHNLWLIDDKYAYFDEAYSSKKGQPLSDIYLCLYSDEQNNPSEIIIIELKSTTHAHNPGEMIGKSRSYAEEFYNKKCNIFGIDIDVENCLYSTYIIASKKDIEKERRTQSGCIRIPFLKDSYYIPNGDFYPKNQKDPIPMRIELYTYNDLYSIASKRNKIFFELLKKESLYKTAI